MQATKEQAVAHHEAAAQAFAHAADAHREAAKHAGSGNFEKAERYSTASIDHSEAGTRHATEAAMVYTGLAGQKADTEPALAEEAAASEAKHAAKRAEAG